MTDPRAENCKAFKVNADNQVIGVELQYREMPETQYRLVSVELIDEPSAKGNTVATYAVYNAENRPTSAPVRLAWPWPDLQHSLLSGNPNNQHMITNGYNPPQVGPLAMYVSNASGGPISDIIGGLGLPYNRHVCYSMSWVDRAYDGGGNDDDDDVVDSDVIEMLVEISEKLDVVISLMEK